jgi:general secretion pathway protein D
MKTFIITLFVFLGLTVQSYSQQYLEKEFKGYTNPDELVTMSASLPFNQAIELLSKVSEKFTGKNIVSTVNSNDPIGIEINNMAYDKALVVVVQYNGLIYEEKENVIVVKKKDEVDQKNKTPDNYASVNEREVKISAVFFELDVTKSRERGIDWKLLLSGNGLNLGTQLNTGATPQTTTGTGTTTQANDFNLTGDGNFQAGNFFGEATAAFKFLESEDLGEIIASPNVVVREGQQGRIQVGSDFSVKQKDFAGNVVEKFFPTGTIIEVTPYVYTEEGLDYTLLKLSVERSTFQTSDLTTEIRKTSANTQVVLLDGEETVLGGLFTNEQTTSRSGIPFLKDLPWWVLGIRYLTGYDKVTNTKKELVILIKSELVPTLKERLAGPKPENPLKEDVLKNRQRIKYYQLDSITEDK